MEYARAAIAIKRLDDDVLMVAAERADFIDIGRDQRRRHHAFKMRDEQFLGRVAHMHRVVHHKRLRMDMLKDMGRGDIGHVERRVLAHKHDVHRAQIQFLFLAEVEVTAHLAPYSQRAGARYDAAFAERQFARQIVVKFMAALLRFKGKSKS